MNTVEPIKDIDVVNAFADFLRVRSERNYILFVFGIYTGLRISDILPLRVRDVKDKKYIYIREKKTNKEKRFIISKELLPLIKEYVFGKKDFEFLFKSAKGFNKPITRQHAYYILNQAGKELGISAVGTHTLRKTFGFFMYQQTKDITAVKELLNQSSETITRRYIGLTQDMKDNLMQSLTYKHRT